MYMYIPVYTLRSDPTLNSPYFMNSLKEVQFYDMAYNSFVSTYMYMYTPVYTHNYSLSPPVITHLASNETLVLFPDSPRCLALTCC